MSTGVTMGRLLLAVALHPDQKKVHLVEVDCKRQRVSTLVRRYASGLTDPAVMLNGQDISEANLRNIRVKPGDKMLVCPRVGFWAWLWTAAVWLFKEVLVPAAIGYGVSYAAGELFGSDLPDSDKQPAGQSFGYNPRSAQGEGGAIPWESGQNMNHGTIVAKWTEVDGTGDTAEILYIIVCFGEGPTEGNLANGIFLNDRPITDYAGVTTEERKGTWNQTAMTNFPKTKLETRIMERLTNSGGPITVTLPREGFDDIEYTFGFDHGMWRVSKSGHYKSNGHSVKVEVAEYGTESWTTLHDAEISGYQRAPYYRDASLETDHSFTVDRTKRYKLKFTKTGADNATRRADYVSVRAVRGVVDIAFKRPGKALLGIKAVATSKLSGDIDVKVERKGKICLTYNGSSWVLQYSHNRAFCAYTALVQPCITGDGGGTAYAIDHVEGFTQAQLDTNFFYEWSQMCDDQVDDGDGGTEDLMPLHHIFDQRGQLWDTMHQVCQIGRAHLVWTGSLLTGWIDKAWSGSEDLITSEEIDDLSWRDGWASNKKPAGTLLVFYQDASLQYKRISAPVHNTSAGRYQNVVNVEAIGCKSRGFAERIGAFALKRNELIRTSNIFTMGKGALKYKPGDVHPIQRNVPNWGTSYRVRRMVNNSTLLVDRQVEGAAGDTVYIRTFDAENGVAKTTTYTLASINGSKLKITTTFSLQPIYDDVVAVGSTSQIAKHRVKTVEWMPDHRYEVTVENYDSNLWAGDSTTPTVPYPGTALPNVRNTLDRFVTLGELTELIEQLRPPELDIDVPVMANITWESDDPSAGKVSWSATTAGEDLEISYKGTAYAISASNDVDKFIYWIVGNSTFSHTNTPATMQTALVNGAFLVCINDSGTAHPVQAFPLLWAGLLQAGSITAALGILAAASIGTAEIIDLNVTTAKVAGNAITVPVSAYTSGSITVTTILVDVVSLSIDVTAGDPVEIVFTCAQVNGDGSNVQGVDQIKILRDGTQVYYDTVVRGINVSSGSSVSVVYKDTPPSDATVTYKVQLAATHNTAVTAEHRSLFCMSVKK